MALGKSEQTIVPLASCDCLSACMSVCVNSPTQRSVDADVKAFEKTKADKGGSN